MRTVFKITLTFLTVLIIFSGCSKKKEQTNIKAAGTYETEDHWFMTIGGETMDGKLDYNLKVFPVGLEDTVSLNNVNKTFDDVIAIYRNDSVFISDQTIKSTAGKKYDIKESTGTFKGKELDLKFIYTDFPYENLTGMVVCNITATNVKPQTNSTN